MWGEVKHSFFFLEKKKSGWLTLHIFNLASPMFIAEDTQCFTAIRWIFINNSKWSVPKCTVHSQWCLTTEVQVFPVWVWKAAGVWWDTEPCFYNLMCSTATFYSVSSLKMQMVKNLVLPNLMWRMDSGNLFIMNQELPPRSLFHLLCWSSVKCFTNREWESEELNRNWCFLHCASSVCWW